LAWGLFVLGIALMPTALRPVPSPIDQLAIEVHAGMLH